MTDASTQSENIVLGDRDDDHSVLMKVRERLDGIEARVAELEDAAHDHKK